MHHAAYRSGIAGDCKIAGYTSTEILRGDHASFGKERQFQCPVCKKVLQQRHQYVGHINVHFNLAPFKCRYCSKTFPYQTSLSRHMRTHHTDKHDVDKSGSGETALYQLLSSSGT